VPLISTVLGMSVAEQNVTNFEAPVCITDENMLHTPAVRQMAFSYWEENLGESIAIRGEFAGHPRKKKLTNVQKLQHPLNPQSNPSKNIENQLKKCVQNPLS
jgi:hypothetical protein